MNAYRTKFAAVCPVNGQIVQFDLRIETLSVLRVESIRAQVGMCTHGFHEAFADQLHAALGGRQTLVAFHHGVEITTTRGSL